MIAAVAAVLFLIEAAYFIMSSAVCRVSDLMLVRSGCAVPSSSGAACRLRPQRRGETKRLSVAGEVDSLQIEHRLFSFVSLNW